MLSGIVLRGGEKTAFGRLRRPPRVQPQLRCGARTPP